MSDRCGKPMNLPGSFCARREGHDGVCTTVDDETLEANRKRRAHSLLGLHDPQRAAQVFDNLRAENDALRAEVERLKAELEVRDGATRAIDKTMRLLSAEVERLKAERDSAERLVASLTIERGNLGLQVERLKAACDERHADDDALYDRLHAYTVRFYRAVDEDHRCGTDRTYQAVVDALDAAPESVKAAAERADKDGGA